MPEIKTQLKGLRFGKKPPVRDYRTFMIQTYLKDSVPTPPAQFNALERVYKNIDPDDPAILFPMDANDQLGDCTIAGMAHGDTVWSALVGNKSIYPVDLITRIYFHLTGGDDAGLAMLDVLKYFKNNVVAGEQIYAYVTVNPYNHVHVKQAMKLFGGLFVGFQVQEKCLDEFAARTPWKPGRLLNAGHAIFAVGYDTTGVQVLTWGNTQWGTWDWWDLCVDECYAVLPPEAIKPGFAPGFDFVKLQEDLKQISRWF